MNNEIGVLTDKHKISHELERLAMPYKRRVQYKDSKKSAAKTCLFQLKNASLLNNQSIALLRAVNMLLIERNSPALSIFHDNTKMRIFLVKCSLHTEEGGVGLAGHTFWLGPVTEDPLLCNPR